MDTITRFEQAATEMGESFLTLQLEPIQADGELRYGNGRELQASIHRRGW